MTGAPPESGDLVARVTRFGRLLRRAGLPLGPGPILTGIEAIGRIDVTRRDEFYWALHASWVRKPDERALFREAFRLYWREPDRPINRVFEELMAISRLAADRPAPATSRRVLDALDSGRASRREGAPEGEEETVRLDFSDVELLRRKDFEQMTAAELAEAERIMSRMTFPVRDVPLRRWQGVRHGGPVDMQRTLRATLRAGHGSIELRRRRRRQRPPPLVALCDISGSMAGYTRMLIRFLHALTNDRDRVHTFLFGTRLSNATRALRHRDPDVALSELSARVRDWEGGTRIGRCLEEFNRTWSRRVLSEGAWVLLITDGLDRAGEGGEAAGADRAGEGGRAAGADRAGEGGRAAGADLGFQMDRLRRSARRLVWLNPLLRYAGFQPEARGIRVMLPRVDDFRPVHNLESLESLAEALADAPGSRRPGVPRNVAVR